MGIYSNTVNLIQLTVTGDIPSSDRFEWLSKALAGRGFRSIDETNDELSEGWVHTDAPDKSDFEVPAVFWRDRYVFFTYRRDIRKISGAVLKNYVSRAEAEYLAKRPELKRPPKREREEIKDRVKLQLLAKTLPTPSTVDAVWDLDAGVLNIFTSSESALDRFDNLFVKTFEGLRLQLIFPYARGLRVLGPELSPALTASNQAGSDAATDQIASNRWIGQDLLAWLLCNGLNGRDEGRVTADGVTDKGTVFSVWIDDRIQFQGGGEGGPQKVVVSGSQDKYAEARSALQMGKVIDSATVYIEMNELEWRFRLDGEKFVFSGFRCPPVRIEREGADEMSERESAFYERMYLLGQGLQLFDSLLIAFLQERTGTGWPAWLTSYQEWLETGE